MAHAKVTKEHLSREAVVYIRQSSPEQIRNNRESGRRQYGLVDRAASLGWNARSVKTVDEDQGRSGRSAVHRQGFGQFEYDSYDRSPSTGKAKPRLRPVEDWPVCKQNALPPYISWEQFLENQRVLRSNGYRGDRRGAPRKGAALLQGIAFCGCCGSKMGIQHYATKEKRAPAYISDRAYANDGKAICQCMSARPVDEAVTKLFLKAVAPAKVDIALRALDEVERDRATTQKEWQLQIQHAEYEVQLAKKRYEAVDPENRLVAGSLETDWEGALKNLAELNRRYQDFEREQGEGLGEKDRELIKKLSDDLEGVWWAKSTTVKARKTLLRFLVKRVHLDGVTKAGKIRIEVEWHTGAHSSRTIDRPLVGVWAPRTPEAVVKRIQELHPTCSYEQIANTLNKESFRSAKGKSFDRFTVGYIIRSRGWGRKGGKVEKTRKK